MRHDHECQDAMTIVAPYPESLRNLLRIGRSTNSRGHFSNALSIAIAWGVYDDVFDYVVASAAEDQHDFRYLSSYYGRLVTSIEELIVSDLATIMSNTPDGMVADVRELELHAQYWVAHIEYVDYGEVYG